MSVQRIPGVLHVDRNPQWRPQPSGEGRKWVLSLRLELRDGSGVPVPTYDVEMRGRHIHGFVRAGDEVEVFAKRSGHGWEASAIHNVKTHAWVITGSANNPDDPPEDDPASAPDLGNAATVVGEPEEFREEDNLGELLAFRAEWAGVVRDVEMRPTRWTDTRIEGTVQRSDDVTIEGEWRNNILRAKQIRINATGDIVKPD